MLAVALALCSSVAWGVSDFVAGLTSRRLPTLTVMLVAVTTGLALAVTIVGAVGTGPPEARYLGYAAISAALGSVGLAALYHGLATGTMSIVAPIAATGAAVPFVYGLAVGERPEPVQAAGAALAVAGVVLAAREPAVPSGAGGGGRARLARGAPLALLAALGLGGFLVAIDAASEGDVAWAILVNRGASLALLALAAGLLRPRGPAGMSDAAAAIGVGLLETSANLLIALASTLGLVSVVGVLASLYPVVTIGLARAVLGERIARTQGAGAAAALAGVVLIAAGPSAGGS